MNEFEEIIKKASGRGKPGKEPDIADIPRCVPQSLNKDEKCSDYWRGYNDGYLKGYGIGLKKCKEKE